MSNQPQELLAHSAAAAGGQTAGILHPTVEPAQPVTSRNGITAGELAAILGTNRNGTGALNSNDPFLQHARTRQATPALLLKEAIQSDWLAMNSSVLSLKELNDRELEIIGDPDPSIRRRLDQQAHQVGVVCHWILVPGASAGALHRALGNFLPGASGHGIDHVGILGSVIEIIMTGNSPQIRAWAASCPDWIQVTWLQ